QLDLHSATSRDRTRFSFSALVDKRGYHHCAHLRFRCRICCRILDLSSQGRRRKGKRGVAFIVDVVDALGFGIVAMPIRARVRRLCWNAQVKIGMQIFSWSYGLRIALGM